MLSLTFRKAFDGKASYSMVKNGNVLIMISASEAVGIPCYTKSRSKIRKWIQTFKISSEQQRFVDAGKLCVTNLSRM